MDRTFNTLRHTLFAVLAFLLAGITPVRAQYATLNFDEETTIAMTAALFSEYQTEKMSFEIIEKILKEYSGAEVAAAGIFMTTPLWGI